MRLTNDCLVFGSLDTAFVSSRKEVRAVESGIGIVIQEHASTLIHPSTNSSTKSFGKAGPSRTDTQDGKNCASTLNTSRRNGTSAIIPPSTNMLTVLFSTKAASNGSLNVRMAPKSTPGGSYPASGLPASDIPPRFKGSATSKEISTTQPCGLSMVST